MLSVSAAHQFAVNRWNPGYTGGNRAIQPSSASADSGDRDSMPARDGQGTLFCLFSWLCRRKRNWHCKITNKNIYFLMRKKFKSSFFEIFWNIWYERKYEVFSLIYTSVNLWLNVQCIDQWIFYSCTWQIDRTCVLSKYHKIILYINHFMVIYNNFCY